MSLSRKRAVILGALVAVIAAAAAYAYWTAGGGGSGSASTGTTTPLTVNQTVTLNPMYPGDSTQTLSGNFDNPNTGPIYVDTVTASIGTITAPGTCDASDFSLTFPAMTVQAQVPAGNGVGSWSGAKIQFNNKAAVNQNGCKNATVQIVYTIS